MITVTWEEIDGLRLYINNRLLNYDSGRMLVLNEKPTLQASRIRRPEFILGTPDFEFHEEEEENDSNSDLSSETFEDVDVESDNNSNNIDQDKFLLNKNRKLFKRSNFMNGNQQEYEFIIQKLIQYDSRKYPDQIIAMNFVKRGN
jgi:hypothetical protein